MANNMYGYDDYNGPEDVFTSKKNDSLDCEIESDTDDIHDPLRVGMWLEGDSLAPPCGSSLSVVRSIIELAFSGRRRIEPDDSDQRSNMKGISESSSSIGDNQEVLYDLGCGDGRVCLEAYWKLAGRKIQCVGIEIEEDLVERFKYLIAKLPPVNSSS
eukprot:CAMPEP_0184864284 /NCGR_PEP_ID=MMETSP0580-20130426/14410_1 /TAXON_ID=1118495 /ORGANISM="Dactyliosolen fragilissimus" /LENGTH=157 /DNA_ID=CAMNT_0027362999 /DNA_START=16 /DNA_END=489 /DNA_ORIENTATION=+